MKVLKLLILTSRNSENASASGGKPPDPLPSLVLLYERMKSLEMAHLTSRNSENASASGGKPPDPPPLLGVVILHIGMMKVLKLLI